MSETLLELWNESTVGTPWSQLDLNRELTNCEKLAVKPRIPDDHLIFRIFRAFNDPQRQIKVVLLGQDPYPEVLRIPLPFKPEDLNDGEEEPTIQVSRACGFSFSSPLGGIPVSLRTIFREILQEFPQRPPSMGEAGEGRKLPLRRVTYKDYSGDLSYLIADGVMLLNTYLTIHFNGIKGISASHTSWLAFTTQILNFIRRICPDVVYLALGKNATDLLKASGINDAIECDHPASRGGGRKPFKGSDIFSNANALLVKRGIKAIDWIPMKKSIDCQYYDPKIAGPKIKEILPIKEPIPVYESHDDLSASDDSEDEPDDS